MKEIFMLLLELVKLLLGGIIILVIVFTIALTIALVIAIAREVAYTLRVNNNRRLGISGEDKDGEKKK